MNDPDHPIYKFYNATVKRTKRINSAWSLPSTNKGLRSILKNKKNLSKSSINEEDSIRSSEEDEMDEIAREAEIKDQEKEEFEIPPSRKYFKRERIRKCDLSALVQTIEEIENKLKMVSILRDNEEISNIYDDNDDDYADFYDDFLSRQFAILSFERNYHALKAHQNDEPF